MFEQRRAGVVGDRDDIGTLCASLSGDLNRAVLADAEDAVPSFVVGNAPGSDQLSFVGVMSVGGHGSGAQYSGIWSQVTALRLVSYDNDNEPREWRLTKKKVQFRKLPDGKPNDYPEPRPPDDAPKAQTCGAPRS